MSDHKLSDRQQALLKIWDSQGVPELLQLLVEMPAARDPDLVPELRDEASRCEIVNPVLAHRLAQISETLEHIHELVHAFALVRNMRGFVACHHHSDLCWAPEFPRVITDGVSLLQTTNMYRTLQTNSAHFGPACAFEQKVTVW
jgi:hypothetical protein